MGGALDYAREVGGQVAQIREQEEEERLDREGLDSAIADFETLARGTSERLAGVAANPDQNLANRYFEDYNAPIQSRFMDQANQVSQYLSRQGLGSSGINISAHSELAGNAAALEGQARRNALNMAIEQERQGLLQSFNTSASALSPRLQRYGIDVGQIVAQMNIDAQMRMMQQQLDAQMWQGIGQTGGMILGATLLSDGVAKTNIEYTGEEVRGVPIVTWEYKGMPGVRFRGVIAEDLERVAPEYVHDDGYFKSVDYGFLDG